MTNIPFIADGGYNSSATASVALTTPAGIIPGNLLVAFVTVQDQSALATVNTLAGWTPIANTGYSVAQNTSRSRQFAFWKVVVPSEAASFTFTGAANGGTFVGMDGNIRAYAGTNGTTVINGTATAASTSLGAALTIPAISETTFVKGEKVVYCMTDTGNTVNSTASPTALSDLFTAAGVFESYVIGDFDPTATPPAETIGGANNFSQTGIGFTILPGPAPLTSFTGKFGRKSFWRFAFNSLDQPVPQVGKENFHWQSDFKPAPLNWFRYNSWDQSQPPVIDQENPHFVFDFKPAGLSGFKYNSWDQPTSFDLENPHFIGRYQPTVLRSFRYTNIADIPLVVIVPETNTHFVGYFSPAILRWFRYNSWDIEPPVIDRENPHFVSDFKPATFLSAFRYNNWDPTGLNTPAPLPPPPPPPLPIATATIAAYHRRTIQKNFDITRAAQFPQEFVEDMALEVLIQAALAGDPVARAALDQLRDGQVATFGGSLDWRTLQGLQ